MLWVWLLKLLVLIGKLFVPPQRVYTAPLPFIDPNGYCPSCGNCSGKIECVPDLQGKPLMMVMHTCMICGAHWLESTVMKENAEFILPSDRFVNQ